MPSSDLLFGLILFIIVFIFLSVYIFAINTYNAPFREGCQKQMQGDWVGAQNAYTRMLKRKPRHWQARLNRALMAFSLGQIENAFDDLEQLIADHPELAKAYNVRGDVYMARKEYGQAIEDYRRVLSLKHNTKENSVAKFKLGLIWIYRHNELQTDDLQRANLLEQAAADFDEAIRFDPQNALPYAGKAALARLRNDQEAALGFYKQALQIDPNSPWVLTDRSGFYIQQGRFDDAIADATRILMLYPAFVLAYNNRGYAYSLQGKYEQALADCNRALAIQPTFVNAFSSRGHTYFLMERIEAALADFQQADELEPKNKFVTAAQACAAYAWFSGQRTRVSTNTTRA